MLSFRFISEMETVLSYEPLMPRTSFSFLVIDKSNGQLGLFNTSAEFIERGAVKVQKAIEVYNQFFSKDATDDVHQFYRNVELL